MYEVTAHFQLHFSDNLILPCNSALQLYTQRPNFTMADFNLQEVHDFMISIAKQAGERIVAAKPTTEGAGNKKNCKNHL